MNKKRIAIGILLGTVLIVVSFFFISTPRNDRDWDIPQSITASAQTLSNGDIQVHNIRNFRYRSPSDYDIAYYDKTVHLQDIKTVDFIVDPFTKFRGVAHIMLAFGFADGTYLDVSIEARREKDESYHTYQGLLNQYELMYVVSDERDVLALRTNTRNDAVYLYPVTLKPETAQDLFVSVMKKVNKLNTKPEFYNTLTNNCTTALVEDINSVLPQEKQIDFSLRYVLPGYADKLAYDLGFIDTSVAFDELRERSLISEKAKKLKVDENFSQLIRE